MSDQLIPLDMSQVPVMEKTDLQALTAASFLPRLQFYSSKSDACASGKVGINSYGLVTGNAISDLGKEIEIIAVAYRPLALKIDGDEVTSSHDMHSDFFKEVMELSKTKDSGCLYGPQFLVWLPSAEVFCTFLMGSKSARRESPVIIDRINKATILKSHEIKTSKYTWWAPLAIRSDAPVASLPDPQETMEQVIKFMNPPKEAIKEKVEEAASDRER